jgi:hypothetical protein
MGSAGVDMERGLSRSHASALLPSVPCPLGSMSWGHCHCTPHGNMASLCALVEGRWCTNSKSSWTCLYANTLYKHGLTSTGPSVQYTGSKSATMTRIWCWFLDVGKGTSPVTSITGSKLLKVYIFFPFCFSATFWQLFQLLKNHNKCCIFIYICIEFFMGFNTT